MKKFEIDKFWTKRSFVQRWAARVVAKMILDTKSSYQCSGRFNWASSIDNTADVQVPAIQFAHWILREAGYFICQDDLKE